MLRANDSKGMSGICVEKLVWTKKSLTHNLDTHGPPQPTNPAVSPGDFGGKALARGPPGGRSSSKAPSSKLAELLMSLSRYHP